MIAYITLQGARVVKEGKRLIVKYNRDTHNTFFIDRLDRVMVFGAVEFSHAALALLFTSGIETTFFTQHGRYIGHLALNESKNIFLRQRQFRLIDDCAFSEKFARIVVNAKLKNMSTVLLRINRSRQKDHAKKIAKEIQALLPRLEEARGVDSIRGYEGKGSALYFSAFGLGLSGAWNFDRRTKRPPTDPVNSVLSLLYSFLYTRVYSAVRSAGLDPYLGHLHTLEYGRYSLVLDLMEEFRTIVADTLALSLFNLKILNESDFEIQEVTQVTTNDEAVEALPDINEDPLGKVGPPADDITFSDKAVAEIVDIESGAEKHINIRQVKLMPEALRRVIENFERKLTAEFFHSPAEKEITLEEAFRFQAMEYRRVIEGDLAEYRPVLLR